MTPAIITLGKRPHENAKQGGEGSQYALAGFPQLHGDLVQRIDDACDQQHEDRPASTVANLAKARASGC